jgi:hypothetical protein
VGVGDDSHCRWVANYWILRNVVVRHVVLHTFFITYFLDDFFMIEEREDSMQLD